jgi:hypothetical protein
MAGQPDDDSEPRPPEDAPEEQLEGHAAVDLLGAALFVVALVPPLVVAWPLWDLVGGQRGIVLAASSLWVTATVEQVCYHALRARSQGGEVGPALRRNKGSIKRLSWAVALADIALVVVGLYVAGRLGA